jgi:Tfp pilus assembly protein PilZ
LQKYQYIDIFVSFIKGMPRKCFHKFDAYCPGQFEWATSSRSSLNIIGQSISVDNCGNSYVTGLFNGTLTFGSFTLISFGNSIDIFVTKLDQNGKFTWATQAGGINNDGGFGISVDNCGNSYVTGSFSGTATFGAFTLVSSGLDDIFVAKLDKNGNFIWVTQAGGSDADSGVGISVDNCGNSYVTGYFVGTATFGPFTLVSSGLNDIFVAKLDKNGKFIWVTQAGGTDDDKGYAISVDNCGNSYVTGSFNGTATFGAFTLISLGLRDLFITKLDKNGKFIWVTQAGGDINDIQGLGISVDGNNYVTGVFIGTATFGSFTLVSTIISIFVAKLDKNGNFIWVKQAGGNNSNQGVGISIDNCGNSYVTGSFSGSSTFGSFTLVSAGSFDIFITKLDINGQFIWATQAGGIDDDKGYAISVDNCGNSYVTGYITGNATFDAFNLTNIGQEMFVAKIKN